MAEQAYAYVTLIPVAKGFQRRVADELSGAAPAAATAGARTGRAFSGAVKAGIAVGAAAATTAVAGLGVALSKGFGRLQAIEEAQSLLIGTGNSAADVERVMENALAAVKGTAFGLGDAARVAAGAVAAGIEPGQELEKTLKAVADTAAVAGAPIGEIGAIFNKVTTANRAYTLELNQLADRGIPIYQYLADQVGVTAEEIRGMASDGEISSEMFRQALADNISGAALEMGETVSGSFANVQASIGRVGANLLGPIYGRFAEFFNATIEGLGPLEGKAKDLGESIGKFLNPRIDTLVDLARNLSVPIQTVSRTMGNLSDRAGSVAAFFSPIVQAFAGLAPLLPPLVPVIASIATLFAALATEALTLLVPLLANFISTVLPQLIDGFLQLVPPLVVLAGNLGSTLIPLLANLATAIVPILTTALNILFPVLTTIATIMSNISPDAYVLGAAIFFGVKAFVAITAKIVLAKAAMLTFYTSVLRTIVVLRAKVGVLITTMHHYAAMALSVLRNVAAAIALRAQIIATAIATRVQLIGAFLQSIAVMAVQRAQIIAVAIATRIQLIGAFVKSIAVMAAQRAAMVATRAVLIAQTVATKSAAAAQKALNFVMNMSPLAKIITLISLVVAGLVYFFTQTEIGQRIWQTFTQVFLATVKAIGDFFRYVFTEWLPAAWSSFTEFLSNGWDTFVGYFETALEGIGNFFKAIINGWISMFEGFINFAIGGVNGLIDALNKIQVNIPATPFSDAFTLGVNLPRVSKVSLPRLAEGGLVTGPTTALIGEAGPEVVIPLDRFESMMGGNGMGGTVNYYAAPNKSFDAEQELLLAMRRARLAA